MQFSQNVDKFKSRLEKQGGDFICDTCLPDASVSVLFQGSFQGKTVLWNMALATLAYYREAPILGFHNAENGIYPCPFIEISEGGDGEYLIRVGLDLAIIDEPAIKKTIIMIRNYRRLVIGKIEFCAANT